MNQVLISARGFYLVMFGLYYFTIFYYPNYLHDSIIDFSNHWFFVIFYLTFHFMSIYLFLTAGKNPGFVDATETPQSRREKAQLFVGQYDEFKGVTDSSVTGFDKTYEGLDS